MSLTNKNTLQRKNDTLKRVYIIENDFWCANQPQVKNDDNGYFYGVEVALGSDPFFCKSIYSILDFYSLKSDNPRYILSERWMTNFTTTFLESPKIDKEFLKFRLLFTDKPIRKPKRFQKYNEKKQENLLRLLEKTTENAINLKWDEPAIRMFQIKEVFETFGYTSPFKLDEYIEILDKENSRERWERSLKDTENFNLYYFKDVSECLKELQKFTKKLRYFRLLDDINRPQNIQNINCGEVPIDETTTLKASQFMDCLIKNIDSKKIKEGESFNFELEIKCFVLNYLRNPQSVHNVITESESLKMFTIFFKNCCNYLKNGMLENKIFLLIGGKYDIDYYFKELYKIIYSLAFESKGKDFLADFEDENYILCDLFDSFIFYFEKQQSDAYKNLCETEYIPKYFFEILKKKVITPDDYMDVEKILYDFINILTHLASFIRHIKYTDGVGKPRCSLLNYSPVVRDEYNIRIVDGIEICFGFPAYLGKVKVFDGKGEEVAIEQDIDYFYINSEVLCVLSAVLRKKNIHEIELISFDKMFKKNFKVKEYLNL